MNFDIGMSGCTCTLVILVNGTIYCGFIGDSLLCLSKNLSAIADKNTTSNELIITKPIHLPDDPLEKIRIFGKRGEVRSFKGGIV